MLCFVFLTEALLGIVIIVFLVYCYLKSNFDFWKKLHVVGPKPNFLFGNFKDIILGKINHGDYLKSVYDAYPNEPVVGLFVRSVPFLLLRDPDIIKDVMIKNFLDFADRGLNLYEDIDPLSQNLIFLDYARWKPLRNKLTAVFTSAKLKEMFYLIDDCADHFKMYIEKLVDRGKPIECCELTAKFTTDVIGVCAFGLNMNALSDEDSEFRRIGRQIFLNSFRNRCRRQIRFLPYWLARLLKPIVRDEKTINFFVSTLRDTMELRRINNIRRHDFVDLLMDIKDDSEKFAMSELLLTAQAYVFFVAGFETTSTAMSHAMYELALNPDVQDKLRKEVNATYEINEGKLTYESVNSMKYMDKVLKEALRKYPPALTLIRMARKDYTFDVPKLTIPKGTRVLIPVYALHNDPNNYPDPDKFDPEHFEEEAVNTRHQMTYLAFGHGPRNCIGDRFAQNQFKVGLAMIVKNFKIEVCEQTAKTYVKMTNTSFLKSLNGLYLTLKKI